MKNLTILLALVAFGFMAKGQETLNDRTSGKYFRSQNIENFTGNWVSNVEGREVEFEITTKKVHFKSKDLDFFRDALYIKINKYMNNSEDFAKRVTEPFMLVGNPMRYTGRPNDPITKNELSVRLDFIDKNNLVMKVHTLYATKTGTFFHQETKLTRKK